MEPERCRGETRSPPSLSQKDEDRVGEADIRPKAAGAGPGMTGGVLRTFDEGSPPVAFEDP